MEDFIQKVNELIRNLDEAHEKELKFQEEMKQHITRMKKILEEN